MLSAGSAFQLRKSEILFHHLWIILLDPEPSGRTIMVNITSRKPDGPDQDLTLILQAGEHPYIKKESVVFYQDTRFIKDVKMIEAAFTTPNAIKEPSCSTALLKKIQDGILVSPFVPQEILEYFKLRTGR